MSRDIIRKVRIDSPLTGHRAFVLTLWDTGRYDSRGQTYLGYELRRAGSKEPLFSGEDFAGSPMHSDDSDDTIACLLGFLTLRPGDTDREYFDDYTADQTEWAASYECECLSGDVCVWEEEHRTSRVRRPWRNV